jgi:hypothetical protein
VITTAQPSTETGVQPHPKARALNQRCVIATASSPANRSGSLSGDRVAAISFESHRVMVGGFAVLDLIEFKGVSVMRSEIRQAHTEPPVKILWL